MANSSHQGSGSPWPLVILSVGVGLALVLHLLGGYVTQRAQYRHWEQEHERTASVAAMLGVQVESAHRMLAAELGWVDDVLLQRLRQTPASPPDWVSASAQLRRLSATSSHLRSLSVVDGAGRVLASSHPRNVGLRLADLSQAFSRPLGESLQYGRLQYRPEWYAAGDVKSFAPSLLLGRELLPVAGSAVYLLVLLDPNHLVRWDAGMWASFPGFAWVGDGAGTVWSVSPGAPLSSGDQVQGRLLPATLPAAAAATALRPAALTAAPGGLGQHDSHWPSQQEPVHVRYRLLGEFGLVAGVATRDTLVSQLDASRQAKMAGWFNALAVLMLGTAAALAFVAQRHQRSVALLRASEAALQASSAAKTAFVANMSHELRTPIAAILGWTDLLLAQRPVPAMRESLQSIRDSGQGLMQLVDRVLDFARLQTGLLVLAHEPWSLQALCGDWAETYRVRARDAGLDWRCEVTPDVPVLVRGDARRWQQVLDVLLDNALRFTPAGGRVSVLVERMGVHQGQYHIRVSVTDNGPGMSAELRRRLFQGFVQADASSSRAHGGMGLNLALARELARAMGGNLTAEAPPDGGTCMVFTSVLEAATAADEAALAREVPPSPQPQDTVQSVSVLSVEDNAVNQQLMVKLLQRLGCQVDTADDGEQAVARCTQQRYDLVLMDLQMPRLDGLGATQAIRAAEVQQGQPVVPIVALTAHGDAADEAACLAAGMQGFLNKPISPARLTETLQRHTGWRPGVVST